MTSVVDTLKARAGTSHAYRRLRDLLLRRHRRNLWILREDLARLHLQGEGIEIGPMTTLEHLEDPIRGLHSFVRVVRPDGIVLLTLPDPRFTFDASRTRTSIEHVLRDHHEGAAVSRPQHYEEWARDIEGLAEEGVPQRVTEFARDDARHHFHVWELSGFLALLHDLDLPAELIDARAYAREFAVVLRRG